MDEHHLKRVSRLTAMVTQLQTKPLVTATQLARKFEVSIRTIYRDIKALEQAGIPILVEEGRGYKLMAGYKLPPVAFTQSEAGALVAARQLISKSKDGSLISEYDSALSKVKAILDYVTKEKVELLSSRIAVSPMIKSSDQNASMALIQKALTHFKILEIIYSSEKDTRKTKRKIEPFALYYSLEGHWLLIAFCQLRKDFRMFRLDRIRQMDLLELDFKPASISLDDFLSGRQKKFTTPDTPLS